MSSATEVARVNGLDPHLLRNGNGGRLTAKSNAEIARDVLVNASENLLRERFSQLAGLQYGEDRDVYKVAGYPETYTFEIGWARYRRQGLAKRIVDLPVSKTWRHRPTILEDDEEGTAWTEEVEELWERLGLANVFPQADRMASIGEYAVIFLGLRGATTDQELKEPVEPGGLNGPQDVLYARAFKESDVEIADVVKEPDNPRNGYPETYRIDFGSGKKNDKARKIVVHWTRVLHIVEDPLDSDVYGQPRLEAVLNALVDIEKLAAATSEAFWQLAVQILQVAVDPDAALTDPEWQRLDDELEDLVHDLRRHFMGQGVNLEFVGGDSPDPSGAADLIMMLAAVAAGIPKRILFGTETGERASEQDERAFLGTISERIEQYAEPRVVRNFVDRCVLLGALDEPKAGKYDLTWPALFELSEVEKADVDQKRADTAKALAPVGGDPRRLVEVTEEYRVRLKSDVELSELEDDGFGDDDGLGDPPPGDAPDDEDESNDDD